MLIDLISFNFFINYHNFNQLVIYLIILIYVNLIIINYHFDLNFKIIVFKVKFHYLFIQINNFIIKIIIFIIIAIIINFRINFGIAIFKKIIIIINFNFKLNYYKFF